MNENGKRQRNKVNWRFKEEFDTVANAREFLKQDYKREPFKTNALKSGTKVNIFKKNFFK